MVVPGGFGASSVFAAWGLARRHSAEATWYWQMFVFVYNFGLVSDPEHLYTQAHTLTLLGWVGLSASA